MCVEIHKDKIKKKKLLRAKEQLQQKCRIKCQHRKIISILYTNDEQSEEKI